MLIESQKSPRIKSSAFEVQWVPLQGGAGAAASCNVVCV